MRYFLFNIDNVLMYGLNFFLLLYLLNVWFEFWDSFLKHLDSSDEVWTEFTRDDLLLSIIIVLSRSESFKFENLFSFSDFSNNSYFYLNFL